MPPKTKPPYGKRIYIFTPHSPPCTPQQGRRTACHGYAEARSLCDASHNYLCINQFTPPIVYLTTANSIAGNDCLSIASVGHIVLGGRYGRYKDCRNSRDKRQVLSNTNNTHRQLFSKGYATYAQPISKAFPIGNTRIVKNI